MFIEQSICHGGRGTVPFWWLKKPQSLVTETYCLCAREANHVSNCAGGTGSHSIRLIQPVPLWRTGLLLLGPCLGKCRLDLREEKMTVLSWPGSQASNSSPSLVNLCLLLSKEGREWFHLLVKAIKWVLSSADSTDLNIVSRIWSCLLIEPRLSKILIPFSLVLGGLCFLLILWYLGRNQELECAKSFCTTEMHP